MGRKRKPDAIREIEGIPSTTKRKQFAFKASGIPIPPSTMDGEALAEWQRVVPVLTEAGLVGSLDRAALVGWCETWAVFVAAARDVSDRGVIVPGARNGEPVKNPAVAIQRDAAGMLRTLAGQLGLTPAARAGLPDTGKPDPQASDAAVLAPFGADR